MVAISELKASLSEYISRVRAGEEVMLTDRGIPVAKLVSLSVADDADAALADLVRSGQVRPAEQKLPKRFWTRRLPMEDPEDLIRRGLEEERESGW